MKEMEYKKQIHREILHSGIYEGRVFYIVSYGNHPCAYVEKLENEPKDYADVYYDKVEVHGGFTWCNPLLHIDIDDGITYLGWDYNHWNDFCFVCPQFEGRKWTTQEIFEEVKSVINQLNKLSKEN